MIIYVTDLLIVAGRSLILSRRASLDQDLHSQTSGRASSSSLRRLPLLSSRIQARYGQILFLHNVPFFTFLFCINAYRETLYIGYNVLKSSISPILTTNLPSLVNFSWSDSGLNINLYHH